MVRQKLNIFKLQKFKEIDESVSSKAVGLAFIVNEIQAGTVNLLQNQMAV